MDTLFKTSVRLLLKTLMLPYYGLYRLEALFWDPDILFHHKTQMLSLLPGYPGIYLRGAFLKLCLPRFSENSQISFGTVFSHADTEIGDRVYIGLNCNIGSCRIENNVLFGSNVHVLSGKGQHRFDRLDIPIQEQKGEFKKITIGPDTWIGNQAVIMADIGSHCIVGAGSVVTQPVEDYSVVAGNPAKLIKKRG